MQQRAILFCAVAVFIGIWLIWPSRAPATPAEAVSAHFFGSLTGSTSTVPTAADALFTSFTNAASSSIDIALYELNRESVRDALIAAHQRGVAVRVVGDNQQVASIGNGPFFAALAAVGIPIVTDDPRSSLQHNKFAIFDRTVTWTGSANFTNTAFSRNGENVLVITSTTVADIYTSEFEEMFGGTFSTAKVNNTADEAMVAGRRVQIAFSPSDGVEARIANALQTADVSIQVAMFAFTSDPLADALIAAHQRGVAVEVLLNAVAAGAAAGERDRLCAAGIRLRVEDWTGTLHNKYAIVDAATTSDPLVITGSTNWSASGVASNDENTIIVHDPAIAAAYAADFERLKAPISAAAFGCNLEDASAADTQLFLPWLRSPQNNQSPAATPTAVVGATPTPTPPPPSFSSCSTMPDVTVVPNWPVQIMAVDKVAETVTLRNAGAIPVDLNGWVVCSITGGQRHPGISGSLAPGESRVFTNNGGPIWNNSSSDPAALYDALGRLISFLAD